MGLVRFAMKNMGFFMHSSNLKRWMIVNGFTNTSSAFVWISNLAIVWAQATVMMSWMSTCGHICKSCQVFCTRRGCQNLPDGLLGMSRLSNSCLSGTLAGVCWSGISRIPPSFRIPMKSPRASSPAGQKLEAFSWFTGLFLHMSMKLAM